MRYRLNERDVVQETVDGEALIIHTPSGTYYSVTGTGEYLWNALLGGWTAPEIADHYGAAGEPAIPEVRAAVEGFARELEQEQLVVPVDRTSPAAGLAPAPQPFSAPELQKFTDMQELLLVDPIHEVDPHAGWPLRPEPN